MAKRTQSKKQKSVRRNLHQPSPVARSRGDIEVIARGCAIFASRVLLCRNVKHGYLYLPGGHVEFGESAAGALAREFVEECGLRVRVGELQLASEAVFATKKREHHEMNLVFHVELDAGADGRSRRTKGPGLVVKSREDGIAFEWIDLSAIVDFDIRPMSVKAWLMTLTEKTTGGAEWVSEIP